MATAFTLGRLQQQIFGTLIALLATACGTQQERPVDWHDHDSYSGWVTDAATGQPIEGAVIVAKWQIEQRQSFSGIEGITTIKVIRLEETLTDKEGRFQFAPLGDYTPPLGWERGAFPVLLFFKPGYEPTGLGRAEWQYGEDYQSPRKDQGRPLRKEGWQREIQLYRYLKRPVPEYQAMNPIYQRKTDEQKILDPLMSFANSLAFNLDHAQREQTAIEAQWRAILMVNDEIRRYRPDYQWSDPRIRRALQERATKERRQ